jgi:hypothetical protein
MKFTQRFFEGNRSCPQTEWQILASKPKPRPSRYINHYIPICGRRVTFVTQKELIHQFANWDEPACPKRCQNPRIVMSDIYHGLKLVCLWCHLSASPRAAEFRCSTPAPRVLVLYNKTGQYNLLAMISKPTTNTHICMKVHYTPTSIHWFWYHIQMRNARLQIA